MSDEIRNLPRTVLRPVLNRERSYRLLYVASVIAGLFAWLIISRQFPGFILAPPDKTFARLWELSVSGELLRAVASSLQHMLLGYLIAVFIAMPLGMLMGRVRIINDILSPVITLIYAVPSLAWAPFIMILFGLYFEARTVMVVIMCVFDMLIVMSTGIQSIGLRNSQLAKSFNATRWQIIRLILIPESLPFIFTSLRIGMVRAINGMLTAELFLATVNLGEIMKQASSRFDSGGVLAVVFVICVMGLISQEVLLRIEKHVCHWLPGNKE
ncbi:TPA: ABC transporter permease [Klebsiella michiganensis]|nr:ABC transporter permease [Klebsiella michiganensis]